MGSYFTVQCRFHDVKKTEFAELGGVGHQYLPEHRHQLQVLIR